MVAMPVVVVDVVQVAVAVVARVLVQRLLAHRLALQRMRLHMAHAREAVSPIRCAQVLMVLPAVVETQMEAAQAQAVIEVAPVAVAGVEILAADSEETQMATHSAAQGVATAGAATVALIAGATGLVGKELLGLLLVDPVCREVHSLVRKPVPQRHAKLHSHTVDFSELGTASAQALPLPHLSEVYVCLGTTLKVAGSQEAFRAVDFDAVLAVARTGIAWGATKIGVISAMGASRASSVFYNRTKGEMEDAISMLGYQSVTIVRPSLLAGHREALNQNTRPGEKIALVAMKLFSPLIPSNYKAVQASDVAASLLRQVRKGVAGQTILLSGQLQA